MAIEDLNRIVVGQVYDLPDPDNYKDICSRLRKLEEVCAQKIGQWNAPTLLRSADDNILVQVGTVTTDFSEFSGSVSDKVVNFSDAFDEVPTVLVTHKETNLDQTEVRTFAHGTTISEFYLQITASGAPTSGAVTTVWAAIGKKVQ